jgi:hypothetical protein
MTRKHFKYFQLFYVLILKREENILIMYTMLIFCPS